MRLVRGGRPPHGRGHPGRPLCVLRRRERRPWAAARTVAQRLSVVRRSTERVLRDTCNPAFHLFPDQASTLAARVDNLYFFMIAVSGVLRRARDGCW